MREDDEIYALICGISVDEAEALTESILKDMSDKLDVVIDVGISEIGNTSEVIGNRMSHAKEALQYRFYLGHNSIIRYDEITSYERETVESFEKSIYEDLLLSLSVGDTDKALWKLQSLWRKVGKVCPREQLKNLTFLLLNEFFVISEKHHVHIEKLLSYNELYAMVSKATSADFLYSFLKNFTFLIAKEIQVGYKSSAQQISESAIDYIHSNYMETISLADVAKESMVSEKYLCKVLKMETGKTFKEIQNDIRIKEAVKLMENSNLKTYEVAEAVGLNDARYFGQLFKKVTGFTPREFKNRRI